jgi:hypothetical protein
MDEWRRMVGFETHYEINEHGIVRRALATHGATVGKVMKPCINPSGYPVVTLNVNNKTHTVTVHSAVALAFIGPRPAGNQVNHIDGNKENPHISNLEYVTPKGNVAHAFRTGLAPIGERHGAAVLTEQKVRRIREMDAAGFSRSAIAREVGAKWDHVRDVVNGKNWAWLK